MGNLWMLAKPGDALVITTNGYTRTSERHGVKGSAVMGAGIAKEAKIRVPNLEKILGNHITRGGNHCYLLPEWNRVRLISMPVKHNWWEEADPELIIRSAHELAVMAHENRDKWATVWLPRPGCGNGGLDWADVKPLIEPILDSDRFVAVTYA